MPGYGSLLPTPGGKRRTKTDTLSVTVMDLHGNLASTVIGTWQDDLTEGEADQWVEIYGELSNAQVISHRITKEFRINPADGVAYDEAYAGVGDSVVFVFQSLSRPRSTWRVPVYAPDASWIPDGNVDLNHADVQTFITRTLGRINDGGLVGDGDYALVKAYYTDGRGGANRRVTYAGPGSIQEPGIGDSPGEGPGDNPIVG